MSGHHSGNPYVWEGGANAPHICRYFLARGWVMPGETVIDAACCTGYGSHLIGQVAKKVYGLEVDKGCIDDADSQWGADNIEFRLHDIDKQELPDADVLISIETMEHVQDLEHFLDQMTKHVRRAVILTVPMGGTSWDYTEEQKLTPAGENNDFMDEAYVQNLFMGRGWKLQVDFRFGYSGFFVFFKQPPVRPGSQDSASSDV